MPARARNTRRRTVAQTRHSRSRTLAAHCVHVDDGEIDLLRNSGTSVVTIRVQYGNAVGCAPVLEMMRRGVRVGLGTDGYTADMFESMKSANLLIKHHSGDPARLGRASSDALQRKCRDRVGVFWQARRQADSGALADIVLVDYDPPLRCNPRIWTVTHSSASPAGRYHHIIGGHVVMHRESSSRSTRRK